MAPAWAPSSNPRIGLAVGSVGMEEKPSDWTYCESGGAGLVYGAASAARAGISTNKTESGSGADERARELIERA